MSNKTSTLKTNLRTAYDQDAPRREQGKKADWKIAERANFFRNLQAARASALLEIGAGAGFDSLFFCLLHGLPSAVGLQVIFKSRRSHCVVT